jgi:ABC-type transporter Mla maintaining outer membrane lipid asymmetry ATPase subunit MlaF
MPLITINQVQKYYGDNHVLKGVDLDIDMGQVISIIGRSGSGKHAAALHQRPGRLSGRQHQAGRHDHYRPGFPGA